MSEAGTTPGAREVGGRAVPAAGTWVTDAAHTTVEFVARHLMSKVRGRFMEASATVEVAEDPAQSSVEVEIDIASVTTGQQRRDDHLRSADFFLVEQHPKMVFRSTGLRPGPGDTFSIDGELTVRETTRPLTLQAEFLGVQSDPYGNTKAGFSAWAEIDREDWGINWNAALESGGFLIGKNVRIEIETQLQRK